MLYWFKFFIIFFTCCFFSLLTVQNTLIYLTLHSELLVIFLFFLFILLSLTFNLSFLVGVALCYLIFSGMELSLNLLLLIF